MTISTTDDFVGLADIIYKRTNLTKGSSFQINDTTYQVVDVINDSSDGFYGAVLYDQISHTLFVVDQGTEPTSWQDWATDVVMAGTNQNLQWRDANALAQLASQDAASLGASSVYTVGHSLGGTLAQMQAAIYGWNGVTFNAYGSGEVLSGLGIRSIPISPVSRIIGHCLIWYLTVLPRSATSSRLKHPKTENFWNPHSNLIHLSSLKQLVRTTALATFTMRKIVIPWDLRIAACQRM